MSNLVTTKATLSSGPCKGASRRQCRSIRGSSCPRCAALETSVRSFQRYGHFCSSNSPMWFFHVFPISGSSSLQHAKDVSSLKNINIYLGNPFKGPQKNGQSPKFLTSSKCHPTAASSAGSYCQLIDAWKSHPVSSLHDLNLKSWIIPGIHLQVDSSLTAKAKTATESRPKGGNTCDWKDRSGPRRNRGWLIGLFVMVF